MSIIITGSLGLIGGELSRYLSEKGHKVIGIDNDTRSFLFEDISPLSKSEMRQRADAIGEDQSQYLVF